MGNNQGTTQYTTPFVPICMALALGLSDTDFNGSGQCDVEDMKDALTNWNRGNSYDIHVVADRSLAGQDSCAVVVEVSNMNGYAFRYSTDEPTIAPDRMIVTNHHRVLIPPVYCERYAHLMDSLTTNPDVTLQRLWNFMGAVGWPATPGAGGTIQTLMFFPELHGVSISFSTLSTPSYAKPPESIAWDDIFPNHSTQGVGEQTSDPIDVIIFPNPSTGSVMLANTPAACRVEVYDISGRSLEVGTQRSDGLLKLDMSKLPQGIYRILISAGDQIISREVVMLR